MQNVNNPEKLKNITNEFNLLNQIAEKYPIDYKEWEQLYDINKKLWDTEDDIRKCEKTNRFDKYFILTARSVYHYNDERSSIKREINLKYGSIIVEEKSYEKY